MDRGGKVEDNNVIPDDLSLLLRGSRPESEDYVANLDREKHTRVGEKLDLTITITSG